jgi:hypothetical protein
LGNRLWHLRVEDVTLLPPAEGESDEDGPANEGASRAAAADGSDVEGKAPKSPRRQGGDNGAGNNGGGSSRQRNLFDLDE